VKIYLFTCSTSLEAGDLVDVDGALPDTEVKIVSLPCSGKVNVPYLVKAFESGADGVMVVTCRQDECQYIQGSFRARNRVHAVDDLIAEIGLGQGRIALISLDDGGVEGVIERIKEFAEKIGALPEPQVS
jgi:coenzyme F420-reducing hydrogenase delta subunit